MEVGRERQRWSLSGLASMGSHGALVVAWVWWSAHNARVLTDMREWRYKPRIVHGKPTPFCYKVRISYEVD